MSSMDFMFSKCRECGDEQAFDVVYGSCRSCTWGYITGDLPPPIPLAKGDNIIAFGNKGVVKDVNNGFVIVKFEDCESTVVFKEDGRLMSWHKEVSLRKI